MLPPVKMESNTSEVERLFELIERNGEHQREDANNTILKIGSLSRRIQAIKSEHTAEEGASKERFNVFNCLTRHHLEELHSNFLSYLLNPVESHDCGAGFLKAFLKVVSLDEQLGQVLSTIPDKELELAHVERERFIQRNSDSEQYGFIDIFIEMPSINIVIENKILAGEQKEQIARYSAYCKGLKKSYEILYLTLFGDQSNQANGERYHCISYKNDIARWLDECIVEYKQKQIPVVHVGLTYYRELINRKILNNTSNAILMKIKDILLKEENISILKYLKEINEATVLVRNELRTRFFVSLYPKLQKLGLEFVPSKFSVSRIALEEIWDAQYRGFRVVNERTTLVLSSNQKVYFCIEHNWNYIYYGLVVIANDNKLQSLDLGYEFLNTLRIIEERMSRELKYPLQEMKQSWVAWRDSGTFKEHVGDDDLNYDFATRKDEFVEQLVQEIKVYLDAWENCLKELKS